MLRSPHSTFAYRAGPQILTSLKQENDFFFLLEFNLKKEKLSLLLNNESEHAAYGCVFSLYVSRARVLGP